ncbi:hypothetical protein [Pseudonocardia sp. WMMC193]|uniref:hypothetical protein n=1 Tax=Pseudonocardia sp. WMMC193 TaxID=2911965 RepID=UPI001F207BFD|nr:hypothetical protein [Pseudonocardia sp. WMMC193]MCF7548516.1 hypothetical protein [Pseudonocardia sp. WMMC193]
MRAPGSRRLPVFALLDVVGLCLVCLGLGIGVGALVSVAVGIATGMVVGGAACLVMARAVEQ